MAKEKKRIWVFIARLMAMVATLSAAIVMGTSREDSSVYGISIHARFYYELSFRYFVGANAAVAAYSFVVLFVPSNSKLWRLVVTLDLVITMLLTSSLSAAIAIGYVGKKGNSRAGWLPMCDQLHKFCNQVMVAIILSFAGVLVYTALLLYTVHTVVYTLL